MGNRKTNAKLPVHPLHGQQALVTGANSGIGRSVALALAQAGADIAINYIVDRIAAEEVAHEIEMLGRRAIVVKADVGKEDEARAMFRRVIKNFSTLHILVNNAGLQVSTPIDAMTLKQWNRTLETNLTGQFLCIREASREFLRRGVQKISRAAGKIICITSVHQKVPWASHASYTASKGGAMMLVKSVAQELAPHKIRVNGIAPGAIRTPINKSAWETPAANQRLAGLIPYRRIGEPDEIGAAASWLASDASDYITGTVLFVDGGLSLTLGNGISE